MVEGPGGHREARIVLGRELVDVNGGVAAVRTEPEVCELPGLSPDEERRLEKLEALKFAAAVAGAVAGGAAFIGFFVWLGAWLNDHWGIYAVLPQVGLMLLVVWGYTREQRRRWEEQRVQGLRLALAEIDGLHHQEFEVAVRDLMRRDGFMAERVGGAGDDACDVHAVDADGRIWVVQCKHRRDGWDGKPTGVDALQQLKGTAGPVHRARVAVIITNGRFTVPAVEWGVRYGVHLIDRGRLERWATDRQPLWTVLEGVRPARRVPGQRRRRQSRPARVLHGVGRPSMR